jgi:pseudaminic acid cytidylyltransferase
MKIAIIPARGGSKRIPKKNIKLFCGKPMIVWSIEAAFKSNAFDKVIVSTDDKVISKISKKNGAEVPFIRPKNLSNDHVSVSEVILHATKWAIEEYNNNISAICVIHATAPFIKEKDLNASYEILKKKECEIVFSATSYPFPIQRAFKINKDNNVEMFEPQNLMVRSQDLEPAYHDAGQFYWMTCEAILESIPTFSSKSKAFLLPRYEVQDIDTEEDWNEAELIFKRLY